ncbi:MAG: phosphoglycolate phosphatase [Proteobacteria bacterium]|jgi:phosphoglycolate phosphatase|nr:phosphoglycolate phosphatase [Pseudomonadota bacterium]
MNDNFATQKRLPSAVIFDLDGTLVDSALDLTAALNHILNQEGRISIENDLIHHMVGQGARALIIKGMDHTGTVPDDKEIDRILQNYLDYYLANITTKTVTFDGVEAVLSALKEMKIPLGVCTNKVTNLTVSILKGLNIEHYFDAVTCGDSFTYRKPDPRHLLSTCKMINADPGYAIMVGDSANDIDAATDANMSTIGVTFGYTPIPMDQLGADHIIDHYSEFMIAMRKITARF